MSYMNIVKKFLLNIQNWFSQFSRYSCVGVINTGIDFIVTLIFATYIFPNTVHFLFLSSIIGCFVAMINSYFLNKTWVFKQTDSKFPSKLKFLIISVLGLLTSSSVFLFTIDYVYFLYSTTVAILIAKLVSVCFAFLVTFIGYKIWAFRSENMAMVSQGLSLKGSSLKGFLKQASVLAFVWGLVHVLYYMIGVRIFGDAVHYSSIAYLLSQGLFDQINVFWFSSFSVLQWLFLVVGFSKIHTALLINLLSHLVLVLTITAGVRVVMGTALSWVVGLLIMTHPRLVEYAQNGYAEMVYITCV